jgi:ABC-2 type transport system permease protein
MNTIFNITKTELKTLFYSPIAWLILVIFTIQTNITFSDLFEGYLKFAETGYRLTDLTTSIFTDPMGARTVFIKMQNNLYLYIPLLTMGLMSREISSGSIKLLFSSPVSSHQIVFGKYLTMLLYGLILIGILSISVIFGNIGINNLDVPYLLSGLLGIYLLICAYSAIGLFMSSLTSYQVVAAFSTLALLGALNYVGTIGQGIEFVREVTYWLSMSGRSETMISGLITSEDIMYFLIVIAIFLGFTIVKLEAGRIRKKVINFGRYVLILSIGTMVGFIFSSPTIKSYVDVTTTKRNTLRENSQEIVKSIDGKLTITTYVNVLGYYSFYAIPNRIKMDMKRFDQYIRFKPDIQLKYVYYWDTPTNNPNIYQRYPDDSEEEIAKKICNLYNINFKKVLSPEQVKKIGLLEEGNMFVRLIEHENGQKTFLRIFKDMKMMPEEKEITVALKRVVKNSIKVGFLIGHGEREAFKTGDRDYGNISTLKSNRESLINNGFNLMNVNLSEGEIKDDIDILVIADAKNELSELETERLNKYIQSGGNLLIAAEPNRREVIASIVNQFGVAFKEGIIVEESKNFSPVLIANNLTPKASDKISYAFDVIGKYNQKITILEGMGLDHSLAKENGFQVTPLLQTKWRGCWNELETTNFEDEGIELNTNVGEIEKPYEMAIALSKIKADKEQRIVVLGDADCFSNNEIFMKREGLSTNNSAFLTGIFEWLSNGEFPVDVRKPEFQDNGFKISLPKFKVWKIALIWLLPLGILITYLSIWLNRRKK